MNAITAAHPRLARLPRTQVIGREVAIAATPRSRLLGLAGLRREAAGAGLLIPRCRSVHTFGMRFPLDLVFLDARRRVVAVRRQVPARRVLAQRGARHVLELPSPSGAAR